MGNIEAMIPTIANIPPRSEILEAVEKLKKQGLITVAPPLTVSYEHYMQYTVSPDGRNARKERYVKSRYSKHVILQRGAG